MMNTWLQSQLDSLPSPDMVVHLGAGQGDALALWQRCGAKQIILVEGNPDQLPILHQRVQGIKKVQLITSALYDQNGRFDFQLFNDPSFSSVRQPTGLSYIVPGLQAVGRAKVQCETAEALLARLPIDPEADNWLVIEALGEEAGVVDALLTGPFQHAFSMVVLTAGMEPLYEGSVAADTLVERLKKKGFAVKSANLADADLPSYCLSLDRMALENAALKAQLAEAKAQEDRLNKRLEEAESQHQELAKERDDLKIKAEEWAEAAQGLEKEKTSFSKQLHDTRQEMAQSQQKFEGKLTEAETEAQKLRQKITQLEQANRKLSEEYQRKEALIDEEFLKAESQIELIKELVFKDKLV